MASDIEICSAALIALGSLPFASFDEANERDDVQTVQIKYPILRDAILAKHDWTFASKFDALTREATAPVSSWQYSFLLPPDRMPGGTFLLYNSDALDQRPFRHFRVVGTKIYANEPQLWAHYTMRPSEGNWPALFTYFMTVALAAECAMAVTDQVNLSDKLHTKAFGPPSDDGRGGLLGECLVLDSQQDEAEGFDDFSLVGVRF